MDSALRNYRVGWKCGMERWRDGGGGGGGGGLGGGWLWLEMMRIKLILDLRYCWGLSISKDKIVMTIVFFCEFFRQEEIESNSILCTLQSGKDMLFCLSPSVNLMTSQIFNWETLLCPWPHCHEKKKKSPSISCSYYLSCRLMGIVICLHKTRHSSSCLCIHPYGRACF